MQVKKSVSMTIKRQSMADFERPRHMWLRGGLVSVLLTGCVADARVARSPAAQQSAPVAQRYVPPKPATPTPVTAQKYAPASLRSAITTLGSHFNGTVAISVRRVDADWEVAYNGAMLVPQQSVSKLWVTMTLLDAVDRGKLTLKDSVTVSKDDLTLFHQPIAAVVQKGEYQTDVADLLSRAMKSSDNTANDILLRKVGGPQAVRGFLARRFISDVRFGPGERLLQSKTAGLIWDQKMSIGRNFYTARANVPRSARERALNAYLSNPPDGAAASSITLALAKLKRGEMLSPVSTAYLIDTMEAARTGPKRVKGGVPAGWRYGHKTGTGQVLYPRSTGYNDVGIMTAPDGTSYAVAVMIASTTVAIPERWELMQGVARAIAASHPS